MAGLHYAQRLELESNASSRTLTSSTLVLNTPALRHRKATGLSNVHFLTVGAIAVAVLFLVVVCIRRILARPVDGYSRRRLAASAGGDGPPRDGNDKNPNDNCKPLGMLGNAKASKPQRAKGQKPGSFLPHTGGAPPPTLPRSGPLVVVSDRGSPVQHLPEEGAQLRAQQQLASFQQHVQKLCSLIDDATTAVYLELDADDANVEPHYAFLGILWQTLNSQLQLAEPALRHAGPFLSNQDILIWRDLMNQGIQTASEALETLDALALGDSQVRPKPLDPSEGIPQSIELLLRLDAATQALRAAMQTNRDASSPTSAAALALAMADARELLLSVNEHFDLGSLDVSTLAGQHVMQAASSLGCLQEEAQASMASGA